MSRDVREFFKTYKKERTSMVNRVGNQIARGGISDMDNLCEILKDKPKELMKMRNIGPKSFDIISAVCLAYEKENKKR